MQPLVVPTLLPDSMLTKVDDINIVSGASTFRIGRKGKSEKPDIQKKEKQVVNTTVNTASSSNSKNKPVVNDYYIF